MRIALLNQYYAPDEAATAQMLTDLGREMAARGHEVVAVCGTRSYADPSRQYAREDVIDGVRVRRVRTSAFGRNSAVGRLADYASFATGAAVAMLRLEPDVVVSLTTPPFISLVGSAAARLRSARSILWSMDVYPDVAFELGAIRRRSIGGVAARIVSRAASRFPDVVVALGDTMAEKLRGHGVRDVRVIHNWADGDSIRPAPLDPHSLRAEWGWQGKFVVLYSGNLGLAHEFETLLDTAHRLHDRPQVRFAFVGGGPRLDEVKARAAALGLTNVEFHPYVSRDDLGLSLTAADLHVVTLRPRMPGLLVPSKIYGILAAGRPVIYVGPAEGEVHEIVRDARCGTTIANGDGEAVATSILGYLENDGRCGEEGRRARQSFDARFARTKGLEAWAALIESLAPRSSRRPEERRSPSPSGRYS